MPKCSRCKSASRVIDLREEYTKDGEEITFVRHYKCGTCKATCPMCGRKYKMFEVYTFVGYEEMEEI